jgi:magnesium-protoporphyrin O-methyltransferase
VARGATHATGIDLGEGAISEAKRLASERGKADRTTFIVGDGSAAELPDADVVVLNRVVCCFPDPAALLERTLPHARAVLAVTVPRDTGLAGLANRVNIGVGNLWFALRERKYRGFRAFVHDLAPIERRIATEGFERGFHGRHGVVWDVAVYSRSSADERVRASS